ncbi:MAG: hypothetical protein LBN96_04190 [Desulfovibrio sp.]|jgi:hypothetical protein|nr:hypothetical protein [Desulfovibrio sp.]
MPRIPVFALLLHLLVPAAATAQHPAEATELWTGSLFTSTYRVGLCFSPRGTVRGVLRLRLKNGKVDVYHIAGVTDGNKIEASHSSGHKFTGRLVSPDRVEGVIALKNGIKIELDGKREHNALLIPEDCAPPEENYSN